MVNVNIVITGFTPIYPKTMVEYWQTSENKLVSIDADLVAFAMVDSSMPSNSVHSTG